MLIVAEQSVNSLPLFTDKKKLQNFSCREMRTPFFCKCILVINFQNKNNMEKHMAFEPLLPLRDIDDLQNGDSLTLEMDTKENDTLHLLLLRDESRNPHWFVMENLCTHDNSPLNNASFDLATCEVECPRHGARFNFCTGKATRMPAVLPIRTFAVKVKDEQLWIDVAGQKN